MEHTLVLLTDYRGALRQRQQVYESLDLDRLTAELKAGGWDVRLTRYEDAARDLDALTGAVIHYTSTQEPGYRTFLDDVLYDLSRTSTLVPRYEIFRAHENKGYQELLRRRLDLGQPYGRYLGNERGLDGRTDDLVFPLVVKPISGFQSRGVARVGDESELRRWIRRQNRPAGLWTYRLKRWLKRHVLRGRYRPEMYTDCVHAGGYVLQPFVDGAAGDWKVLVFGDRYFALRRDVRPGDFRASGSGRFAHDTPPDSVLDFARRTFERLDVPMVSLDIIEVGGECSLVEFQGLHFGTLTLDDAPHYFRPTADRWERVPGPSVLEDEYARALLRHLGRRTP